MWKGVLKLLQSFVAGFMVSYESNDTSGMGSIFQMLELVHTHFTLVEANNNNSGSKSGSSRISESPKHEENQILKSCVRYFNYLCY